MKIRPVGEKNTKVIVAFRNFVQMPETRNSIFQCSICRSAVLSAMNSLLFVKQH